MVSDEVAMRFVRTSYWLLPFARSENGAGLRPRRLRSSVLELTDQPLRISGGAYAGAACSGANIQRMPSLKSCESRLLKV